VKPIRHYAVVRVWGGFEILGVTTEVGRQTYGRRLDASSTHVATRDVIARLPDRDSALSLMERAGRIRAKYRPKIDEARRHVNLLDAQQQREIDDLVKAIA
jgi:hypothetical protein